MSLSFSARPRSARPARAMNEEASFASLLDAAQAGGGWALEQLFRDYQPPLLRYLRGQAADLADDVASETWLAAARGLSGFAGDAHEFRAWLFTIARHRLVDERRRAKRRPLVLDGGEATDVAAAGPSPEDAALDAAGGDAAARRIVALLPADQAEIILLRVVAGLSVEQVALIMGKRAGTVRVLYHRGLKRLGERLGKNV